MKSTALLLAICLSSLVTTAHAADKEHASESAPAAPVMFASAEAAVPDLSLPSTDPYKLGMQPRSSGVAESLPDVPSLSSALASNPLAFDARGVERAQLTPASNENSRLSFDSQALPDSPGIGLLQASPLAGAARRIGAQRFNTDDGSSLEAFAICYRLSGTIQRAGDPGRSSAGEDSCHSHGKQRWRHSGHGHSPVPVKPLASPSRVGALHRPIALQSFCSDTFFQGSRSISNRSRVVQ